MEDTSKLTLLGMVSGLSLTEEVNEIILDKARIFRNPAAFRESSSLKEIRANTAIYSGEGKERHFVGDVATYLIESEIDAPGGQFGHTTIKGSGGVLIGTWPNSKGIILRTGGESQSSVSIGAPLGQVWNAPSLIETHFQRTVLPLRLLTKARILVFPLGVLTSESRHELTNSGLNRSCPEPVGISLVVELSKDNCKTIEVFSKKLAKANIDKFEVPVFLFSRSFHKIDVADRALDLIITLESLLSESSESIGYKIAFRASCLTAKEEDYLDTFQFAKETYNYRSSLVHGNKKKLGKARSELEQRIVKIEDLVRRCLKLACLLETERLILPSGKKATMQNEDSINEYMLTYCLTNKSTSPLESFPEIGRLSQSCQFL